MSKYTKVLSLIFATLFVPGCFAALAESPASYDRNNPQLLRPEHLYAESALLVDEDSGEALFSKNSRVRMYPASTTKIMTLLLALESGIPLDEQVTIPAEAGDIPEGSSVIPVKPGDVTSFSDLLYGFMLSSGNDGANAVAVLVGGSIKGFVEMMNRRAAEIGCEGTHYVNAHGYHDADHYTTAQDLALISRVAMQNPDFRRIVAAPRWTMTIQRRGDTVNTEIISRNSLLQSGEKYYYPDCTGIKTGHHNKAGWCFVGSAERDGMRVICVVLNCEEEMSKWYDAARLFEYGFTCYEPATLASILEKTKASFDEVTVENADEGDPGAGRLSLELTDIQGGEQTIQLVKGSSIAMDAARQRVMDGLGLEWNRDFDAPVNQGEAMGRITVALEGLSPVTAALTASRSVARQPDETPVPEPTAVEEPLPTESAPAEAPDAGKKPSRAPLIIALLLIPVGMAFGAAAVVSNNAKKRRKRARKRSRASGKPNRGGRRPDAGRR